MAFQVAIRIAAGIRTGTAVRSVRRAVGALLVLLGFLVMYGIAWDSTWHGSVGRDKGFLSPPHALMYASAAIAGVLCAGATLFETVQYYRRSGVHDANAVRFLFLFHAPIGLLLSGFGILAMVLAGPLDNYWHSLYGIFVNAWQPLHMMGLIGGGIWGIGTIYLWGALLVQARRAGEPAHVETWGFLAAATVLMRLMMTLSYPALHVFQTMIVGGFRFMTYPVVFTLTTVWLLWAVQAVLERRRSAFALVFALLAFHLLIQVTVPWIVRVQAAVEGRTFFNPTLVPAFNLDRLAPDLGLLVGALVITAMWSARGSRAASASRRWTAMAGAIAGSLCWIAGTITTIFAARGMTRLTLPAGLYMMPAATPADALAALPLALTVGALSALLGKGMSEVLRRNSR